MSCWYPLELILVLDKEIDSCRDSFVSALSFTDIRAEARPDSLISDCQQSRHVGEICCCFVGFRQTLISLLVVTLNRLHTETFNMT